MKIGFFQMTPRWGKKEENIRNVCAAISAQSSDLLVLPEFFATGYLFTHRNEIMELSESVPDGPTCRELIAVAGTTGTAIVAGLPELDGDTLFNTAILVTPGGAVHRYRKTHLFDREKLFFQPGDTGFRVFDLNGVRVGIMICFDWFFPESARSLALQGADIIAHPANLVLPYCPAAMITRCLENRVFAITCNRAGYEARQGLSLTYIGNSRIIDPGGNILAGADQQLSALSIVDIDPLLARNKQLNPRNHLFRDRRTEMYTEDSPQYPAV